MTYDTECEKKQSTIEKVFFGLAMEAKKQLIFNWQKPKKRVIVIAGPTGCGKTEFGIRLAKELGGEIISADSMQIFRGMDIGTAKATAEQREATPHHLLDIRDARESFNVVDFFYEARQACQLILSRDNVPIIVGGSGFYLHSLLYGPPAGPPSIPEIRKQLEDELEEKGPEVLFERLQRLDPQYAKTITKNDKQKIVRALEIMTLTHKKVSKLSWRTRVRPLNYDFRCWFLHRPREVLYKRIDKRCEEMLEAGLLMEVERLLQEGILENSSACQAIGYKQAIDFLKTARTMDDYQQFLEVFKRASRQYAKKQFTWFRKEPIYKWLDIDMHDMEVAVDMVVKDYKSL